MLKMIEETLKNIEDNNKNKSKYYYLIGDKSY